MGAASSRSLYDRAPELSGLLHACIPSSSRCNPAAIVGASFPRLDNQQHVPHQGTLNTVDKMGKDHDTDLFEWVEELKSTIDIEQVMFYWDAIFTYFNVICST